MVIYEFDGEKYKNSSSHQKEWGVALISQLSLKGNEMILDLGCGDGVLTEKLSGFVPNGKVKGIDSSIGMIQTARKIKRVNLEFIQMDINTMGFKNEFDIIYSNAALHWVKNHNRLLEKSYAALKNQGVILWEFGGDGNCSNLFNVVRNKIKEDKYVQHFSDFEWPWFMPTKLQYEELISSIGFTAFTVEEINKDKYFSSSDAIINWIDQPSIVPFLEQVPHELKTSFRNEIIKEMLNRTQQQDGTYFETFRRIKVYAEK